jgi:hypothetical protein
VAVEQGTRVKLPSATVEAVSLTPSSASEHLSVCLYILARMPHT